MSGTSEPISSYGLEPHTIDGERVWLLLRLSDGKITEVGRWRSLRVAQRRMREFVGYAQ